MPRRRTPTNVLELKGSFKHNPGRGRARADEPKGDRPIGAAPKHFTEAQTACYDELVRLAHAGVLCDSDSIAVEIAAVLLASLRADSAVFTAAKFGRLQGVLAQLGMTPADRSKVKAIRPLGAGPDPLDEFAPA